MIPHSKPSIGKSEVQAVLETIRSGVLSCGQRTQALETALLHCLERSAVCVSSGTAALHMALLSLGIGSGMKVAIPTHCCPSVLFALRYVNAIPELYDCGPLGIGAAPGAIAGLIGKVQAVIIVHSFGIPDVQGISEAGSVPLVEDCAASLGAAIGVRPVGTFGALAVFSFYATKMIAGGECGAVTGAPEYIEWIRDRRSPRGADDDITRFPYSPSELCAAVAEAQLESLAAFIERRTRLAEVYTDALRGRVLLSSVPDDCRPAWHRFVIAGSAPRSDLIQAATAQDIQLGFGVKTPLHRLLGLDPSRFPNSEHAWTHCVSLPLYPCLTDAQQNRIISFLRGYLDSTG